MRILLAQNSLYYPGHGGGDISNRLLLEALAARGHACRVVARIPRFGEREQDAYVRELASRRVEAISSEGGVVRFGLGAAEVCVVTNRPNLRAYFAGQIVEFAPDVILSSTDDPAQILLEAALAAGRVRVVYLARATLALPFGPDCAFPSATGTEALRRVDGFVGVSQYVADYARRWGAIDAVHVPISLVQPGPYPCLGRFDGEFVTLVNPCAAKGISIFLALADRLPDLRFGAVPTWGTNAGDRAALEARPNITLLPPVDNIDDLFARTRVLLVPSLWAEARSRVVLEAMLRAIPVLASDVGGTPEAMLGLPYLLPVRPIVKYRPALDEQMVPLAEVPEQDVGPWCDALRRLTSDRAHYEELSRASREAALGYVSSLSVEPFERLLQKVAASPKHAARPAQAPEPADRLSRLSPEKRQLLGLRLRKLREQKAAGLWFPGVEPEHGSALRLFCFPHAGGGAAAFHGWRGALPASIEVCPVRLPGRESRLAEPPFRTMGALIDALTEAIPPYLGARFAFFGHSLGAVVAFELARALGCPGRPLPVCLLVSGARAPRFRVGYLPPPEPSEREFLDQLRRLQGVPSEMLDRPELLRALLPALGADADLYRQYVCTEEPPLGCPIRAYGGTEDPNVTREHLAAWSEQTTRSFALRLFPGGHFFLNTQRAHFLRALAADLGEFTAP